MVKVKPADGEDAPHTQPLNHAAPLAPGDLPPERRHEPQPEPPQDCPPKLSLGAKEEGTHAADRDVVCTRTEPIECDVGASRAESVDFDATQSSSEKILDCVEGSPQMCSNEGVDESRSALHTMKRQLTAFRPEVAMENGGAGKTHLATALHRNTGRVKTREVFNHLSSHLARYRVDVSGRSMAVKRTFAILDDAWFQAFLLLLIFLDVLCVALEALVDSTFRNHEAHRRLAGDVGGACKGDNEFASSVASVARAISIGILCVFTLELVVKVSLVPGHLRHIGFWLDSVIVVGSLTFELTMHHSKGAVLIFFRLWRLVRIMHGMFEYVHDVLEYRHAALMLSEACEHWNAALEREARFIAFLNEKGLYKEYQALQAPRRRRHASSASQTTDEILNGQCQHSKVVPASSHSSLLKDVPEEPCSEHAFAKPGEQILAKKFLEVPVV
mmetsp:Transcript_83524/g.233066  ORF Transcript_83524/g.233066 Transcript_83524/m.233066 type:complete len:444 (-) Transcript_83524:275-1606(-)